MADAQATPDFARIKRNISKMISLGAPETDIDAYVASERVTPEMLRGATAPLIDQASTNNPANTLGIPVLNRPATPQEVEQMGGQPVPKAPGMGESFLRGAEQGVTLGWGDEFRGHLAGIDRWTQNDAWKNLRQAIQDGVDKQAEEAYAAAVARNRSDNTAAQEANPGTYFGGQVVGSAVPALAGSPVSAAARATPLIVRGGAAAVDGLTQGAIQGAGAGTEGHRMAGAIEGGGIGAALGAAGPLIASGLGKVVEGVADYIPGQARDMLSSLSRGARNYAERQLGDPAKLAAQRAQMEALGPNAMPADVSQEWMGVARGAASRPGVRDEVVTPLLERDAGKNARLNQAVRDHLGQEPIPSRVDAGIRQNMVDLRPEYGPPLQNARAVDTQPIADILDTRAVELRGPAQKAVIDVRKMLNIKDTNQLDPNPGTLLETRHAIDGLMEGETNGKVVAALTEARQLVDAELAAKVPGIKAVDAKYAELARQSEGLTRGGQVLDSGKTAPRPVELADEIAAPNAPTAPGATEANRIVGPSAVPLRLRQGALAEIYRIIGNKANDVTALQGLLKGEGDWNRTKLAQLFGSEKADAVLHVLDAETTMARTAARVTAGSDTALTNRFGDFLDKTAKGHSIPTDTTLTGAALRGVQKLMAAALRDTGEAQSARFAGELGRMSVMQGPERDAMVAALMTRGERAARTMAVGNNARAMAEALLKASRPAVTREAQGAFNGQ